VHYRLASKNRISVHCSGAGNIRSKHAAQISDFLYLDRTKINWYSRSAD
jgi:hypothetical protein